MHHWSTSFWCVRVVVEKQKIDGCLKTKRNFCSTMKRHAIFCEKSMENKSNKIINYEASKWQLRAKQGWSSRNTFNLTFWEFSVLCCVFRLSLSKGFKFLIEIFMRLQRELKVEFIKRVLGSVCCNKTRRWKVLWKDFYVVLSAKIKCNFVILLLFFCCFWCTKGNKVAVMG